MFRVLRFLDEIDISATFFLIPNFGGYMPIDQEFAEILKVAKAKGHEICLHGYAHSKNEFGHLLPLPIPSFRTQKKLLERGIDLFRKNLGCRPKGFRAPNYRYNMFTLKALASVGIKYDSSKTVFKPTYGLRFRINTHQPVINYLHSIAEIPVTGDYTYVLSSSNFGHALKRAIWDFHFASYHGGVFVVNFHPQALNEMGYSFIAQLVKTISSKTKFVRLIDQIDMYM